MKGLIEVEQFKNAFRKVASVANSKVGFGLDHALVELKEGSTAIRATDLEVEVWVKIPAEIEQEGKVLLPIKQVVRLVGKFSKDSVIQLEGEKNNVRFKCESFRTTFKPEFAVEDFPELMPHEDLPTVTVDADMLGTALKAVIHAVRKDEYRLPPGVLLDNGVFVATDGYRMALRKVNLHLPVKVILPIRACRQVVSLCQEVEEVKLSANCDIVVVQAEGETVVARTIQNQFPDYKSFLKQLKDGYRKINLPVAESIEALGAIRKTLPGSDFVELSFIPDKGKVIFSGFDDIASGEIPVEAEELNCDYQLKINPGYLYEALKWTGEDAAFMIKDSKSAVKIRSNEHLELVMPIMDL